MPGLDYIIDASYQGEDDVKRFRKDVQALRAHLAAIAKDTKSLGNLSKLASVIRARTAAEKQAAKATRDSAKAAAELARKQREAAKAAEEGAAAALAQRQRLRAAADARADQVRDFIKAKVEEFRTLQRLQRQQKLSDAKSSFFSPDELRLQERLTQQVREQAAAFRDLLRAQSFQRGTTRSAPFELEGTLRQPVIEKARAALESFRSAASTAFEGFRARAARARNVASGITQELGRMREEARGAQGPFRRLFRVMLAYAAARAVFHGLSSALRAAIGFSKQLEDAQLGVAAVLTSVGKIATPAGIATGMEALEVASSLSREQLAKLRIEGLRTSATFKQLAETFQVAVGPGIRAGLSLDFVREFTVRISQAAAAIGLAQDQLNEEIRSILGGTVNQRFTRIAAVLDITNEDIKRARQLGTLQEFLTKKFDAFRFSGEAALQNFTQIISNLKEALELVGGEGTQALFDQLKESALGLQRALVRVDGDDVILSPGAVQIVRNLTEFMRRAVEQASALGEAIGLERFVALSEVFRTISTLAVDILAPVLRTVGSVAGTIAMELNLVVLALRALGNTAFGGVLKTIGELLLGLGAVRLAGGAALKVLAPIRKIVLLLLGGVASVLPGVNKLVAPITKVALAFARWSFPVIVIGVLIDEVIAKSETLRDALISGAFEAAAIAQDLLGDAERAEQLRRSARSLTEEPELTGFAKKALAESAPELLDSKPILDNVRPVQAAFEAMFASASDALRRLLGITEGAANEAEDIAASVAAVSNELRDLLRSDTEQAQLLEETLSGRFLGEGSSALQQVAQTMARLRGETALASETVDQLRARMVVVSRARFEARAAGDTERELQLQADLHALAATRAGLEQDRRAVAQQTFEILTAQLDVLRAQEVVRDRTARSEADIEVRLQRRLSRAAGSVDPDRARQRAQERAELERQALVVSELGDALARVRREFTAQQEALKAQGASAAALDALAASRADAEGRIRAQLEEQVATQQRLAVEQARDELVRESFAASFGAGLQEGARTFPEIMQEIGADLSQGIRQSLVQGAAAALEGDLTLDSVKAWATQAGDQLKAQLVAAIVEAFLVKPVLDFLSSLLLPNPVEIAQLAATKINTSAIAGLTGAVLLLNSTLVARSAVGLLGAAAGGYMGFDSGGAGGKVPSAPALSKAPPGLDRRDRIPGFFRKGEYVATPEMNRRVPGLFNFLERLRTGSRLGLDALSSLPNFAAPRPVRRRLAVGFAEGGLTGELPSLDSTAGGSGGAAPQVLPVVFFDSDEFKRAIASASDVILDIVTRNS